MERRIVRGASRAAFLVVAAALSACQEPVSLRDKHLPSWFQVVGTPPRACEQGKAWDVSPIHYYSDATTLAAQNGCWEKSDGGTAYIDYAYRAKPGHDGTHAWYRWSVDHVGNALSGPTAIASYANRKSDTTYTGTESTQIPFGAEGVHVWLEAGTDTGDPTSLWIYVYTELSPPSGALAAGDSLVITLSWLNSEVHSSVSTVAVRYKDGQQVGADTLPGGVSSLSYSGLAPGTYSFNLYHRAGPIINPLGVDTGVWRLSDWISAGSAIIIDPPQNVQCQAPSLGSPEIELSWVNTSSTHDVELWRADFTGHTGFQLTATLSPGSSSYLDQTTQSGHQYSYGVRYVRGSNTGPFSEVCNIQAP